MMIDLRPACSDDYTFALDLYLKAIKPLAIAWVGWIDEEQCGFRRNPDRYSDLKPDSIPE
jgi:hypothetical protein